VTKVKRNSKFQQQLAEKLEQIPEEKRELVMALLLNNISALISGVEIGKSTEEK
jgi:hypothetical protein